MIDKFKMAIYIVQKKTGRNELKKDDFVRILSFDNRWIEPSLVEKFISICLKINLLEKRGDSYVPLFSTKGMEVPIDFDIQPQEIINFQEKETQDMFRMIVERIEKSKNMKRNEIVAEINRMKSRFKYLTIETVALIYARDLNVDVSDLIPMVEKSLSVK